MLYTQQVILYEGQVIVDSVSKPEFLYQFKFILSDEAVLCTFYFIKICQQLFSVEDQGFNQDKSDSSGKLKIQIS